MNYTGNILIISESLDGNLSPITRELITAGKKLAEGLGKKLHMVYIGGKYNHGIEEYYGYGVDNILAVTDTIFDSYMADIYLQAVERVLTEINPSVIIFGHTDKGMDLAPRLAFRLKIPVTLDCIDLDYDRKHKKIILIKPAYGGKAHTVYSFTSDNPCIVAIRDGAFKPASHMKGMVGEIEELSFSLDPARVRTRFIRKIKDENIEMVRKLTSASIVVGGGRGIKKKEGIALLQETAELFGGAVAGSRPAVDYGWFSANLQVGLTGKKISPKIYIAVGISGSLQHMAGCMKSETIVAVNIDESAPVFRFAHFGAVGDYREVLRGFNNEIRKLKL